MSFSMPVNPQTNHQVGYAFAEMTSAAEVERAIAELSGKKMLERKITVQLAKE